MRHNFRFAGTGGQGLITAAIILAEAAIEDNKEAVQSQSYGPEARGGSSKADCIISDDKIWFNRVVCPDVLLVMSQEAANKYTASTNSASTCPSPIRRWNSAARPCLRTSWPWAPLWA